MLFIQTSFITSHHNRSRDHFRHLLKFTALTAAVLLSASAASPVTVCAEEAYAESQMMAAAMAAQLAMTGGAAAGTTMPTTAAAVAQAAHPQMMQNAPTQLQDMAGTQQETPSAAGNQPAAQTALTTAVNEAEEEKALSAGDIEATPIGNGTYLLPNGQIFDPVYYGQQNQDVIRKYGSAPETLLWHYWNYGIREGRFPSYPITETDENGRLLAPEQTRAGQQALKTSELMERRLRTLGSGSPISLLFIGNSITKYGYNELWWGYWGMGATRRELDYKHLVQTMLAVDHTVTADSYNFAMWESPSLFGITRDSALPTLSSALSEPYDVVVIQLGENITEEGNIEEEYANLIGYIRAFQPSSQIIVVGDFWKNDVTERVEKKLCAQYGLTYVDLSDIRTSEYLLGMGASVYGDDGEMHVVANTGVASHPNDLAMQIIAQRVYTCIQQ